jgi:hypothetical protein
VDVTVATWIDHGKSVPHRITLTGNIHEHKKFVSKILGNDRTLIVYLPPEMAEATPTTAFSDAGRYPVLYMQDGENLFDESTSVAGIEWKADETAERLISQRKIKPVILVGIYNTPDRDKEYRPASLAADGKAELYARFIVEEVKPFIDRTYPTNPDRAHTGIIGSGLGGTAALVAAKSHPDVFGMIGVMTPVLRSADGTRKLLADWSPGDTAWLKGMRVYADMSAHAGSIYPTGDSVTDGNELAAVLASGGLKKDTDFTFATIDQPAEGEAAWAGRFDRVLMFLVGK